MRRRNALPKWQTLPMSSCGSMPAELRSSTANSEAPTKSPLSTAPASLAELNVKDLELVGVPAVGPATGDFNA